MLEGRNFWELVEKRAARTPDDVMTVDEDDREITFGGYRDAALLRGRRAGRTRHRRGRRRVVAAPDLARVADPARRAGPSGRRPEPDHPDLPRPRGRLRHRARPAPSSSSCPAMWRGFDYEAMAERHRGRAAPGLEVLVCDTATLPDGDPATLPPAPPSRPTAPTRPVTLALLHVGHHRRPEGRAPHRRRRSSSRRRGMCERPRRCADGDRNGSGLPVHPHRRASIWLCLEPHVRAARNVLIEAFDPTDALPAARAARTSPWRARARPFHMAYLDGAARAARRAAVPEPARTAPAVAHPSRPQLHYDVQGRARRRRHRVGLGPHRVRPSSPWPAPPTPTTSSPPPRARAMPGVAAACVVTADGTVAGVGEEGELRAKAPQLIRGYLDASLDADAFDEDGWFRTGDLGVIDDAGLRRDHRPPQGRHHPQGREHLGQGGRGPALRAPEGGRRRRHRPARRRHAASGCAR